MTIDEAKAVAKRVTFCGLFSGMTVEVEQLMDRDALLFRMRLFVSDRDHGVPITINYVMDVDGSVLHRMDERQLVEQLHRQVIDFARHEVDEAFLYDGRRPFDPHAHEQGREGRA